MGEIIAGILLVGLVGFIFYILAKKLKISEKNENQDDDFSCH